MKNSRKTFDELNGKKNVTGKNIEFYRKKHKLSRQNISDKLMILGIDLSAQSLYDIEIGNRTIVDYELAAITKILNVSVNELLSDINRYLDENLNIQ